MLPIGRTTHILTVSDNLLEAQFSLPVNHINNRLSDEYEVETNK